MYKISSKHKIILISNDVQSYTQNNSPNNCLSDQSPITSSRFDRSKAKSRIAFLAVWTVTPIRNFKSADSTNGKQSKKKRFCVCNTLTIIFFFPQRQDEVQISKYFLLRFAPNLLHFQRLILEGYKVENIFLKG